jgi:hypothetical protein
MNCDDRPMLAVRTFVRWIARSSPYRASQAVRMQETAVGATNAAAITATAGRNVVGYHRNGAGRRKTNSSRNFLRVEARSIPI